MRKISTCIILLCTAIAGKAQPLGKIPYSTPYPDSIAQIFLPGIVSKDSFDFNTCFSPDGKSYYFTRSENKITKIFVTHHDGKGWSEPAAVPFGKPGFSEADPVFDGAGKIYFISNRPKNARDTLRDYDIYFTKPIPGGGWSEPEFLNEINSDSNEYYISFSTNGNLYFASSRPGGFGQEDIYVSELKNGRFTKPVNLGQTVNTEKSEYDPGISPSEEFIVFASSNREDGFGGADLYYAKRNAQRKWLQAANLGNRVNTKAREFCPAFSPEGKFFFFSSNGDVKWISIQFLPLH